MTCDVCKILENKEAFKFIYEDEEVFAILHESPAVPGHCLVIPKHHATIVEELDDAQVEHLFVIANKVSSAIFDTLGAHGTNIVLNNGTDAGQELPHVVVHVLPRKENDTLDFEWTPKQASESQLKMVKSMLSGSTAVYEGKDSLPKVRVKKEKHESNEPKKEDYLSKSLRRIP